MDEENMLKSVKSIVLELSQIPCPSCNGIGIVSDFSSDDGWAFCSVSGNGKLRFPQLQEYVRQCPGLSIFDGDVVGTHSLVPNLCPCGGTGQIVTEPPLSLAVDILDRLGITKYVPGTSEEAWNAIYEKMKNESTSV